MRAHIAAHFKLIRKQLHCTTTHSNRFTHTHTHTHIRLKYSHEMRARPPTHTCASVCISALIYNIVNTQCLRIVYLRVCVCVAVFVWALWASCVHCNFLLVLLLSESVRKVHTLVRLNRPQHTRTHTKRERQKIGKINFFNQLRRNLQHNGQSSVQPKPGANESKRERTSKGVARRWATPTQCDAGAGGARAR